MDREGNLTELALTGGDQEMRVPIETVIVAGWTGRNGEAVRKHITELEALGVKAPSRTPIFYRVSASRLTTAGEIDATPSSSGEVEPVLLRQDGDLWVGVGSDHTDREVETYGIAAAKQLCDKPLASQVWPYVEVAPHWDQLILRSWIDGDKLYQEGPLSELLHPDQLLPQSEPPLEEATLIFCGTVAAIGGIRPASAFRYELADPVLSRVIAGRYAIRTLPVVA